MPRWLLIFLLALTACTADTDATRQPGVSLPDDYRSSFIHYARVDRPDGTARDLYISPNALPAYRRGAPLPYETTIIIEGYDAAVDDLGDYLRDEQGWYVKGAPFEALHVIQKRSDWTATDFESAARAGAWNFGSFEAISGQRFDESLTTCTNCHNSTPQNDFLYSRPLLDRYAQSGLVAYFYCNLRGRAVC